MTIVFSSVYEDVCEKQFGIKRDEVIQGYTYPDKQQKLLAEGIEFHLYLKQFDHHHLLIYGHKHKKIFTLAGVLKLRQDFTGQKLNKDPLDILRDLVTTFGISVRVGSQLSKFVYNETIPVKSGDVVSARNIANAVIPVNFPRNHLPMANFWFKIIERDGREYIQCALVFCLDITEYLMYLRKNFAV